MHHGFRHSGPWWKPGLRKNSIFSKKKSSFQDFGSRRIGSRWFEWTPLSETDFFQVDPPKSPGAKKRLSPGKRQNYVHTYWQVPLRFRYLLNYSMKSDDFWIACAEFNVISGHDIKIKINHHWGYNKSLFIWWDTCGTPSTRVWT